MKRQKMNWKHLRITLEKWKWKHWKQQKMELERLENDIRNIRKWNLKVML